MDGFRNGDVRGPISLGGGAIGPIWGAAGGWERDRTHSQWMDLDGATLRRRSAVGAASGRDPAAEFCWKVATCIRRVGGVDRIRGRAMLGSRGGFERCWGDAACGRDEAQGFDGTGATAVARGLHGLASALGTMRSGWTALMATRMGVSCSTNMLPTF